MAQGTIPAGNPLEDVHTRTTASGPQSMACCVGIDAGDTVINTGSAQGVRVDYAGSGTQTGGMTYDTTASAGPLTIPVVLTSLDVPCKALHIQSNPTNTVRIAIGDANVNATPTGFRGIPLDPGQSLMLPIQNANIPRLQSQPLSFIRLTWTVIR